MALTIEQIEGSKYEFVPGTAMIARDGGTTLFMLKVDDEKYSLRLDRAMGSPTHDVFFVKAKGNEDEYIQLGKSEKLSLSLSEFLRDPNSYYKV